MVTAIKIHLNENLFLRDPEETSLGRDIISSSIIMIDKLGFEQFTFKKLAREMGSTEASVYRYFENKHILLVYLINWYWVWQEYNIEVNIKNIKDTKEQLKKILSIIAHPANVGYTQNTSMDIEALHRIVISEASKSYLTKEVDELNKKGMYADYKRLCKKIAEFILILNPNYPYAVGLVSMLIEAANHQAFFALHLPSLTNLKKNDNQMVDVTIFLEQILFSAIK
ncbi:MAG: TetR/AcrR family transcriptional regulator [Cytophagales bacterium]|nr:MAG: TetR/AcrR family transcriptional regulator [Cytophagales bacterium]